LPEYKFFRSRSERGEDETAFLLLSDATIRRWTGPRWRIASSRRWQCPLWPKSRQSFLEARRAPGCSGDWMAYPPEYTRLMGIREQRWPRGIN
jgi:hypothetical protein